MQVSRSSALIFCGRAARRGNQLLNLCNNILLLLVLLYGAFALWDTYDIYRSAGVSDSLLQYKPVASEDGSASLSLQELIALYPDVCAWLTIDDTKIDYPLVQGEDNQTYVNLSVEGSFSLSGAIFLDYQNSPDFSDDYSILYGHHMDMQAMFGGLDLFFEQSYLDAHTSGTLFLPSSNQTVEIFAVLSVTAYDYTVFSIIQDDDEAMAALLEYIAENASAYRDISLAEGERILAMSTCATAGTDMRTVVFAKLTA